MSATAIQMTQDDTTPAVMLGGYAAVAESAWMEAAQATDVIEEARVSAGWRG